MLDWLFGGGTFGVFSFSFHKKAFRENIFFSGIRHYLCAEAIQSPAVAAPAYSLSAALALFQFIL